MVCAASQKLFCWFFVNEKYMIFFEWILRISLLFREIMGKILELIIRSHVCAGVEKIQGML